jgi:hypothetical protein
MKKIKIVKHVEIIYIPDELLYDGMSFEEIAKEDVKMVGRYGQSYLISAEGDVVDEQETITWEIIEEDAKED